MKNRTFWGLTLLLVALHTFISVLLLYGDSLTSDEPIHMTAGYLITKDRDLRINREHPPMAKALAGLGFLGYPCGFPYDSEAYRRAEQYPLSRLFVFREGNDTLSMTVRARWPLLLVFVAFSMFFLLFVRFQFGNRRRTSGPASGFIISPDTHRI